ncbi:hypothetical protein C8Q79DRAFT_1013759 [Trametes meyenii]|nr:hypothetical protein C8Q79DRAFT_1013759 [Trametes meyenii]
MTSSATRRTRPISPTPHREEGLAWSPPPHRTAAAHDPPLKSLERIREFFEDVWAFERVFCRCRLSDPASDRPHYDFCQLLGVDLADPWDDWANEALARTARRAMPYLTQFRMLSVPFNRQGRGLHLLQCRRWWDGESPIEFLSLVDNAVIPPFSHNAWDYIPPHPFMHPPTAQISFAFYQNLHTICISTPTHVGAMSQDTIAFYRHPPEPDRNSADNYHIWLTNLPSAGDNKGWITIDEERRNRFLWDDLCARSRYANRSPWENIFKPS